MRKPLPHVTAAIGERHFSTTGQTSRALLALVTAGTKGVTALDVSSTWAYRFGAYVHNLRRDHGLVIETLRESHIGGWHGRYVLHTALRIVAVAGAKEAA
jgi:hypothetical protein